MKDYSAIEIIKGIAGRKNQIIRYVYKNCYPDVRKLILWNGGNEHDAEDIFQEAMLIVYQKITDHGLQLSCRFETYLYSVCRFLWINELEKRKSSTIETVLMDDILDDQAANTLIRETAELKIYEQHFGELRKECQKVLNMYFQQASMEEICVVMGYKSIDVAKDKKYRCKKSLVNKIYCNPEYKRMQNGIHLAG